MPIILNGQGNCDDGSVRGTGVPTCTKEFGEPVGFDLIPKGWRLNTSTDNLPTESVYKDLIQSGTFYNFNNSDDFDDLTPENGKQTSNRGVKKSNLKGLPELSFDWWQNYCFHKNLYDKGGFKRFDVVLKYTKGIQFATDISGSNLKGFNGGDIDPATYKNQKGSDSFISKVMIQFLDADEYNLRGSFYTWEELGFNANDVAGVLNTSLSYDSAPVAGTTISVKVVHECNGSVFVQGLTDPNNWNLGGTQATATAIAAVVYNAATNAYEFTLDNVLVIGDTVRPSLADASKGFTAAINASGDFFTGVAPLATIA